jgi:hypothetical protein
MWGRRFLIQVILGFLYFISLIPITFGMQKYFLAGLIALVTLLTVHIMAGATVWQENRISWSVYSFGWALSLVNILFAYFFTTRIYLFAVAVLVSVIGFLLAVLNIETDEEYEYDKYSEKLEKGVDDDEVIVEEITPLKDGKREAKAEKNYVGSIKRAEYHTPDCLAAKRISKENKIWFTTKADAEEQGYSKHSCIK